MTTYATTIETTSWPTTTREISSTLAVFEHLSLEEMDAHRFIGVPLRVTDDALRERLHPRPHPVLGGRPGCHRNQEFTTSCRRRRKGAGLHALLDGPLAGGMSRVCRRLLERPGHARRRRHAVALPWSPPEVTAAVRHRELHGRAHHHDPGRRPA